MSNRLSLASAAQLTNVALPSYSIEQAQNTIVHLGIGAFHRAHQAVYTEQLNNSEATKWRIIGCSLRSPGVKQQLTPQDCLYSVLERGVKSTAQVIGCIGDVLVGPENPGAIIDAIGHPETHIVSLTVTEKGYCHFPASGDLNQQHPDIVHDLNNLNSPRSAIGFLAAGLELRFRENRSPITILSCDNLPHNGKVVKKVVKQFAALVDPKFAEWVAEHIRFPCTMVDRIVPATTAEDIQECETLFGYQDQGLVVAEPFSQWVIEDCFSSTRPAWEKAGAILVDDVDVFETMKLRLLNGSHSLLAYAGYLAGCETVFDTMQNSVLRNVCQGFMASAATTLAAPKNFDLQHYQAQLIERFSNPSLKHRTWQIAMDGSQKVPQRWLNSVRALLAQNGDPTLFYFAIAAWLRFVQGEDEQGNAIEISDPLADQFAALSSDKDKYVTSFIQQKAIFGDDLPSNPSFIEGVAAHYNNIVSDGIQSVLASL